MAASKKTTTTDLAVLSPKMREMMSMANELSKSGLVPMAYIGKPASIFAAIQYGKEFNLPPMTAMQNIAVINGKPTLGTDLMVALAMRNPEWGGLELDPENDDQKATVTVYRVSAKTGKIFAFKVTFTVEDARKAGLIRPNSPWEKWRARMLKHRATAFAIRDAFPDCMAGTYSYEEMDPDAGAVQEEREVGADDEIHASILDDKGVPIEIPVKPAPKVAPKRSPKATSKPASASKSTPRKR